MNIQNSVSITKNKRLLLFTAITALLLISMLISNSESDAKNKAVKGIIVEVQSGKYPNQCDIYFVDKHGNMKNLTNQSGNHSFPSWSPDGRRITFIAYRNDGWGLYIMDADGSNQRPLYCPANRYASQAIWRPDSKRIAFFVHNTLNIEHSAYKVIDVSEPITETVRFDIELQKNAWSLYH